jgi:hypothetical protein
MRPLSSDLREFIHLLNTNRVNYVIGGAWALAFHGRPRYTGDLDIFVARGGKGSESFHNHLHRTKPTSWLPRRW